MSQGPTTWKERWADSRSHGRYPISSRMSIFELQNVPGARSPSLRSLASFSLRSVRPTEA